MKQQFDTLKVATALFLAVTGSAILLGQPAGTDSDEVVLAGPDDIGYGTNEAIDIAVPMSRADLAAFSDFDVFWLGDEFESLDLTSVDRVVAEGPGKMNFVDFAYGSCDASEGGCPYPLNIQLWPACERNRSSYSIGDAPYPFEPLTIRGVPAGIYDGGARLEVYTGEITIVIFGGNKDQMLRAADALRAIDSTISDPLPAPKAGALKGQLSCSNKQTS